MKTKFNPQLLAWLGVFFLIAVEYCIFRTYSLREIIPFYPKSYDQAAYLAESYKLYESMILKGRIFAVLLHHDLLSQSLLFHVQAALVYLMFGASRWSSLSINFAYFAALQLFSFAIITFLTGRYRYGFIFIGMLLAAKSLVMSADFRIDFIACCLYGALCFAILRSNIFLSRKWTLISVLIAILLVLMRYITICYVLGVLGIVGVMYFVLLYLGDRQAEQQTKLRLLNIIIFGLCLLAVILPVVWLNWDMIQSYYVVGHATGAEKSMRLKQAMQAAHLCNPYYFYPVAFFNYHFSVNIVLQLLAATGICGMFAVAFKHNGVKRIDEQCKIIDYRNIFSFLFITIIVPLFVLSMDKSKSFLVINIILVPFIALLLFIFIFFSEKSLKKSGNYANKILTIICTFFLLVGVYNFASRFSRERGHVNATDKDYVVSKMVNDFGSYANSLGWISYSQASDFLADYINAPVVPMHYENYGIYLNANTLPLGHDGMTAISQQQAFDSIKQADVYTVNLNNYTPDPIFPFESSIKSVRTSLRKFASSNMVVLGEYHILNNTFRVYVRPDISISGLVDNKITNDGIWVDVPAMVAQQIKQIQLVGAVDFRAENNRKPNISASAMIGGVDTPLVANLLIKDHHYFINLWLPNWQLDMPLLVHVRISGLQLGSFVSAPNKKQFLKRSLLLDA